MQNGRVEVGVARSVAATAGVGLADAAGAVDEDLVEAALVGLIRRLVAQVPLAEDAGGVARRLQHLGQRRGPQGQPLAFDDGVRHAVAKLVPAGHQRRARRRAGRADVEVGEADARSYSRSRFGVLRIGLPWQERSP